MSNLNDFINFGGNTGNFVGNITGNYILGNGAFLTGLPEQYANANVFQYMGSNSNVVITTTGNITTTANVQANYVLGNGAQLNLNTYTAGNIVINGENRGLVVDEGNNRRVGFVKYSGQDPVIVHNSLFPLRIGRVTQNNVLEGNAASFTPEIYISPNGFVGINTVSTTSQLTINGNTETANIIANNIYSANANSSINFWIGNTDVGTISNTSVALGANAGITTQSVGAIAIGFSAGSNTQGQNAVAIGPLAGRVTQGLLGIAIGSQSGQFNQSQSAVAIGQTAGSNAQGLSAVSIGSAAGSNTQGNSSVAIGASAGSNTQGANAVAIGTLSGNNTQRGNAIAIGLLAGTSNQGDSSVAIGKSAGQSVQGEGATAVGDGAGNENQGSNTVAIGYGAAVINQGNSAIAIGATSARNFQSANAIAIGFSAGNGNQSGGAIAIGTLSGNNLQGISAIAIGNNAANTSQSANAISIGREAGANTQGVGAIAIGLRAGNITQRSNAVSIGVAAGSNNQGNLSVAVGASSGSNNQGLSSVAIGDTAGAVAQGNSSIAIGPQSALNTQGTQSIAIGSNAGQTRQGNISIAIGRNAALSDQANSAIAIGDGAGGNTQRIGAIAIGTRAGANNQGNNSIAIGALAGNSNQVANSIVISAGNVEVNATNAGFYVNPVRQDANFTGNLVYYNPATDELTYNNVYIQEYNEVALSGIVQVAANTIVDYLSFTLPSAGVWEVDYVTRVQTTTQGNLPILYVRNTGNAVLANTELTGQLLTLAGGSNTYQFFQTTATGVTRITTSGPETFKLSATCFTGSGNVAQIVSDASGRTKVDYKKIGGFAPATGVTTSFITATRNSGQGPIGFNTDIVWDNQLANAGNISLNISTGVFTLQAGVTYNLYAAISASSFSDTTNGFFAVRWVDATTNSIISQLSEGIGVPVNRNTNEYPPPITCGVYTPSTNQTVKVRVTGANGTFIVRPTQSIAQIIQLGTTNTTGFTGAITNSYSISNTYASGTIVVGPDGMLYQANNLVPAGTAFVIGTTGATWRLVGAAQAEWGEVSTPATTTATAGTTVDVVSFTLPSAGVWEVQYQMRGDALASGAYPLISITDNSNVVVTASQLLPVYTQVGAGATVLSSQATATGTVRITTTDSTVYKVRMTANTATCAIRSDSNGGVSKVTWKKISGFTALSTDVPAFSATGSGNTVISATFTPTQVAYGTVVNDTNGWFANNRYTPQRAGWYQINCGARCLPVGASNLTGERSVGLRKNNTYIGINAAYGMIIGTVSQLIYFNGSTDNVDVVANSSETGNIGQNPVFTFFSGCWVRP